MVRDFGVGVVATMGVWLHVLVGAAQADQGDAKPPENFLHVGERIYSGGEPHSDAAFEFLAEQGIKTVVSVDGAKPDVEAAKKHGLRYIHIPIGYDGVPEEAERAIARVKRDVEGPVFFHCQHGTHRGPAAASIACVATGEMRGADALTILERAGTSKDYAGLWRDVEAFVPPAPGAQLPELVEVAEVSSFAAAMAMLDRANDNLKLCRDAGWTTPADHPDLVVEREARLLFEGMRESARNAPADSEAQLSAWLAEAEVAATEFESAVRAGDFVAAAARFNSLAESCKKCHFAYRN
jgi:protein tyrosine phosphatase (PTP) superfamily phosphohydrolase (DUF442 family)